MNLAINYNYKIQYLPTSRHKKTREACMEEVMDVMIPELTEEEFPLAFEVTKMESVYPGAKDYRDFERQREESEYRLFTQQIRKYQGKLYKEVFATYGVGISTLHACPEEYIRHVLRKKTYRYVPEQDFPYKKDVSVIVSSEKKIWKPVLRILCRSTKFSMEFFGNFVLSHVMRFLTLARVHM